MALTYVSRVTYSLTTLTETRGDITFPLGVDEVLTKAKRFHINMVPNGGHNVSRLLVFLGERGFYGQYSSSSSGSLCRGSGRGMMMVTML